MKWLKKPCGNCPFNRVGAIPLMPGRVEGIVADLLSADNKVFHCHKTTHHGEWIEDDDGVETYQSSGKEAICTGSMIYLLKAGRPSIAMRMAFAFGWLDPKQLLAQSRNIIDHKEPSCSPTSKS